MTSIQEVTINDKWKVVGDPKSRRVVSRREKWKEADGKEAGGRCRMTV